MMGAAPSILCTNASTPHAQLPQKSTAAPFHRGQAQPGKTCLAEMLKHTAALSRSLGNSMGRAACRSIYVARQQHGSA